MLIKNMCKSCKVTTVYVEVSTADGRGRQDGCIWRNCCSVLKRSVKNICKCCKGTTVDVEVINGWRPWKTRWVHIWSWEEIAAFWREVDEGVRVAEHSFTRKWWCGHNMVELVYVFFNKWGNRYDDTLELGDYDRCNITKACVEMADARLNQSWAETTAQIEAKNGIFGTA